ncbi:MAG: AsmA family protein [Candidatus Acidiferrales bacterium]
MKRWTKILLGVLVLFVVAIVCIKLFVNANTFRPAIEKQITDTLGRNVKLGDLSLAVFSGSLVAEDISVGDDPNFSSSPFLTAKEVRIGVSLRPLIFSHQLNIRSFEINSPQIAMIRAANGTWNFSSIGRPPISVGAGAVAANAPPGSSQPGTPQISEFSVGSVAIKDGLATITSLPAHGPPTVYQHVNLTAHDFSTASRIPFDLKADLPGGGSASVTGYLGPINRDDAANIPIDAQISAKRVDPVGAGLLDSTTGLSFLADAGMKAKFDGQTLTTSGTARIENLKLHKGAPAVPKPLEITFSGTHRVKDNSGQIEEAAVKIGDVKINASGTYRPVKPGAEDMLLNFKVVGQSLPIDQLQPLMTAAAVHLPNNSTLKGGTFSMNMAVTGPTKSLVITGPIALDNTSLVGFNISSKIHGIAALGSLKTGDTTHFDKLRANVRMTDAGVVAGQIESVIEGMGELTGSGTVSPTDQLDFNLLVKVASANAVSKVGIGVITGFSGNGVPIHVAGTTDEPYITTTVEGGVVKKTKSITSIFHKKN